MADREHTTEENDCRVQPTEARVLHEAIPTAISNHLIFLSARINCIARGGSIMLSHQKIIFAVLLTSAVVDAQTPPYDGGWARRMRNGYSEVEARGSAESDATVAIQPCRSNYYARDRAEVSCRRIRPPPPNGVRTYITRDYECTVTVRRVCWPFRP